MNLEIASRLVSLRKANNLSQEALAEKLGISRQAVSKWERAEAAPDTDNLIALAKLYHVSLDELLLIHEEEEEEQTGGGISLYEDMAGINDETADMQDKERESAGEADESPSGNDVHIGFNGIHVREHDGNEVHIDWHGIHVRDKDDEVHIDKNGVFVNGEKAQGHLFTRGAKEVEFPLGIFAIVIYIVIGVCFNLWHPAWILFLLIPVVSTLFEAVRRRNANLFAYPCLVIFLFLYAGFVHFLWHPAWVLFLTIPLYYSFVQYVHDRKAQKEEAEYRPWDE